ncbi:MAG TPA: Rieske (2Fe-2S) protein [Ktedonobacterales bacterium]
MDHHDDQESAKRAGKQAGDSMRGDERRDDAAERVEDYLRLEEHIAQLQADRRPSRPRRMRPDQTRTYQMAALFRSAAPDAAQPDAAFVAQLRERLDKEIRTRRPRTRAPGGRGVSRRGLLTGGLSAAAAAAGIAVGIGVDRATAPSSWPAAHDVPLVPVGQWISVVAVDALPMGAVRRFVTDHVVGFVRHTENGFEALSGACTHMGCLVAWNAPARTFDCPCHGGRFLEDGRAAPFSPVSYQPLPTIRTRVEAGQVQVYIPPIGDPAPSETQGPQNPYRTASGRGSTP